MKSFKKLLENHSIVNIRFRECERMLIILKSRDGKKQELKWVSKNYFKRNYPGTSKFYNL